MKWQWDGRQQLRCPCRTERNTRTKVCAPICKADSLWGWGLAWDSGHCKKGAGKHLSPSLTTLNIASQLRGELSQSAWVGPWDLPSENQEPGLALLSEISRNRELGTVTGTDIPAAACKAEGWGSLEPRSSRTTYGTRNITTSLGWETPKSKSFELYFT